LSKGDEMQNKGEYSFTLNHYENELVGGTGHVSITGTNNNTGKKTTLSVHPDPNSLRLPFSIVSFLSFPTKSINYKKEHIPPTSSYDITDEILDPEKALQKSGNTVAPTGIGAKGGEE
jgi:hypothetical protein